MPFKTDYKGIHERAYQKLKIQGRSAWSDSIDTQYRGEKFSKILSANNISGKILVLGCGDGEVSVALVRKGYSVLGIDISPTAIEWAREKSAGEDGIEFVEGSVLELDRLSETFTAAIDDHCFHCIIGDDRIVFLGGIFSRLNSNGLLIVRTQCGDPPTTESPNFMKMWDPVTRCQVHNGVAGRYFGIPKNITAEITSVGFKIIQSDIQVQPDGWQMIEVLATKP
jgi:SAM-dependent methyltransferase